MMYKKLKRAFLFLLVCMMFSANIQAQDKRMEKANNAFSKFAFIDAAKIYKRLIKSGDNSIEIYTKLGDCYYYNGDYPQALEYYSKVLNSSNTIDPEYYFRYAQVLNSTKDYKEAEKVLKTYYQKSGKKDLSENWNEAKLLENIKLQSGRYSINEVEINTKASDFGTAFYDKDKVIYASARDTGIVAKRKHSWNDKSFLKLYSANITVDGGLQNAVRLKGDINTKYHQSTPAITKDGKYMFFTRNNYKDGKLVADKKGISNLKIYIAENVNGEWKNIKELGYPLNSDAFSSAHPALSADESELYFASDRDNKFGDSDLYVVSLKKNGYVGNDVRKLGDEINTLGRETYPFVDSAGTLYFSSDGHPGLGGLDVFAAIKDETGLYHVVNVGDGINTAADDFAYVIKDDSKKGYFSSNRNGNDDIFGFTENRPATFDFNIKPIVSGVVTYATGEPIEGMAIEIHNVANELIKTVYSDKDGKYSLNLEPYKEHSLVYKKTGLVEITNVVTPLKPSEKRTISNVFIKELEVIVNDKTITLKEGDDLTKRLQLSPIYFDYSGDKIRESSKAELDKIIEILKGRHSISLTVNSYTDSRGRDDFNMKLSESRAKATVDYIISKGIDKDRVTGKGYGETRIINKCTNGVPCTEMQHQENRRSEFIILIK